MEQENILLSVEEGNVDYFSENFEIEIYEIKSDSGKEILYKLEDNKEILELFDIICMTYVKIKLCICGIGI